MAQVVHVMEPPPLTNSEKLSHPRSTAKELCTTPIKIVGVQDQTCLSWDESGDHLLFASNNRSIYLWKMVREKGGYQMQLTRTLSGGHKHPVVCSAFDPNFGTSSQIVTAGADGIIIWDATKGDIKQTIQVGKDLGNSMHEADIECVKFIFNGMYLLTGSKDCSIKIWDVNKNFALLNTLNGHKAPILALDFSPEKELVATAGRDSTVKIWDVSSLAPSRRSSRDDDRGENAQLRASMDGHRGDVCTLTFFNKGNNIMSGARDNSMKIWSIDTGREEREVKGAVHNADVRRIIFIPPNSAPGGMNDANQNFVSCGLDGHLKVWKLGTIMDVVGVMTAEDMEQGAKQMLADIMSDGAIKDTILEDGVADMVICDLQAHENVWAMECCKQQLADGSYAIVTASSNSEIRFWKLSMMGVEKVQIDLMQEYVGHREELTSCQMVQNEKCVLTSSLDYSIHLYDLQSMQCINRYDAGGAILRLAVTSDGKYMFCGGTEYAIKMYQLFPPYQKVASYVGHSGKVISLSIKTVGNEIFLVSGGHDFNIILWKVVVGEASENGENLTIVSPIKVIEAHQGHVMDLQFSRDFQCLASGGNDHAVKCWEFDGNTLNGMWENSTAHTAVVTSVCWGTSKSANFMFSTGWDSCINVWDKGDGRAPKASLYAHAGRVTEIELTPNGLYLYSCGADMKTFVWNALPPFNCLCQYRTATAAGEISTLSVGNFMCCTGDGDGLIRVWPAYGVPEHQKHFTPFHNRRVSYTSMASEVDKIENE